jgi:ribonuclease R
VRVQVSRVDLDGRRIDFALLHEGESVAPRGHGINKTAHADRADLHTETHAPEFKPSARKRAAAKDKPARTSRPAAKPAAALKKASKKRRS